MAAWYLLNLLSKNSTVIYIHIFAYIISLQGTVPNEIVDKEPQAPPSVAAGMLL